MATPKRRNLRPGGASHESCESEANLGQMNPSPPASGNATLGPPSLPRAMTTSAVEHRGNRLPQWEQEQNAWHSPLRSNQFSTGTFSI